MAHRKITLKGAKDYISTEINSRLLMYNIMPVLGTTRAVTTQLMMTTLCQGF